MSNPTSLVKQINSLRNAKKLTNLGDILMLKSFCLGDLYHLDQEEVLTKIRDYQFEVSLHSHAAKSGGQYFLRFYPDNGSFSLVEEREIEGVSGTFKSTNPPRVVNAEVISDIEILKTLGFNFQYLGLDQSDWN